MRLPDWLYDILKYLCILGFPVLNTMLLGLQGIWHWDIPMQAITDTITVVATAIGGWLCINNANYYKDKTNEEYIPDEEESKTL